MIPETSPGLSSWWRPDPTLMAEAVKLARQVVETPEATDDLISYYTVDSNYAGATFADLAPNDPYSIGPADLLAVTTLSVDVKPYAIRTLTELRADEITSRLEQLDPELRLESIDPATHARPMGDLQDLMRSCLGRAGAATANPWVTASKLCARKRPHLFPVRDNVVLDFLGLPKTYPVDWPAFQGLMADQSLMAELEKRIDEAANADGVAIGDPTHRLRHLDVVLWMHAIRKRP